MHPVSYGSAILTDSQRNWSTVQKELYALVHFCDKYQNYLLNTHFHVITDNKALLHLENFKNIQTNRLWRWFETLQKFDFDISYSPSKQNPRVSSSHLRLAVPPPAPIAFIRGSAVPTQKFHMWWPCRLKSRTSTTL